MKMRRQHLGDVRRHHPFFRHWFEAGTPALPARVNVSRTLDCGENPGGMKQRQPVCEASPRRTSHRNHRPLPRSVPEGRYKFHRARFGPVSPLPGLMDRPRSISGGLFAWRSLHHRLPSYHASGTSPSAVCERERSLMNQTISGLGQQGHGTGSGRGLDPV